MMNTSEKISGTNTTVVPTCYHCGETCEHDTTHFDEHDFCCEGCATVYDLLKENDLCNYYKINSAQGISPDPQHYKGKYDHLDLPDVSEKLLEFTDGRLAQVSWLIPKMHCSSCIWLLEKLYRLNPAIRSSVVNFPEKKVRIVYDSAQIKMSVLAELLSRLGYDPYISLDDLDGEKAKKWKRTRLYKIGIAGFAFGNIMMLSFPEYFSSGQDTPDRTLRLVFDLLNIGLSLPVLFYCAGDFFKSAWTALRGRFLNIDSPIALALLCIFSISLYQIMSHTGPGYLDSFAGAVFFMLIGRYFQDKTYSAISFERDYKSYFPVAVTVVKDDIEKRIPITNLKKEDQILVRNEELIPADSVLMSPSAFIDYSFVSGEAAPVERRSGDTIYAGGKQIGGAITLKVLQEVSQSYLTQLWNNDVFTKEKENESQTLASRINSYFSSIVFVIATLTFVYWFFIAKNPETAFLAFTTCLLVACPCALLLSSTFTNGNLLSLFGKGKFYLKNADAIDRLSKIDTVVFDKTGTITMADSQRVEFIGRELDEDELVMVKMVAGQSAHPLSRMIVKALQHKRSAKRAITGFTETSGSGISATWGHQQVRLGSASWVGLQSDFEKSEHGSRVYLAINEDVAGYFSVRSQYRPELPETITSLQTEGFETYLLSGDKPTDRSFLLPVFGDETHLMFDQKPDDKLKFIAGLQKNQMRNVLMVGDGLNDSGALQQSNVGVVVSDDINNFSPACDAIIEGNQLSRLPAYIKLAKAGQTIIKASFTVSLLYNLLGLSYAMAGNLSPVIAAILMPVSSITIVLFTTAATNWGARKFLKN
jgi:Cu+-exporting ATPase